MSGERDIIRLAKRSVVIAGHKTSVSLEQPFWDALKSAAVRRQMTINDLVTEIDTRRAGNLSSAIRVFLLGEDLDGSVWSGSVGWLSAIGSLAGVALLGVGRSLRFVLARE